MIKYKLTDENYETYNHTKWGVDVTHETSGVGELCGKGWLHVYDDPVLALFLNPIHANFKNPVVWEVEVSGKERHDMGLKSGYTKVRTVRIVPHAMPAITQIIAFGIITTKQIYKDKAFTAWADKWLSGEDRSYDAASAAADAAAGAAGAADATAGAADAADATAYAAYAAGAAADAAARAAAYAARAAAYAARAAADAAIAAARAARAAAIAARAAASAAARAAALDLVSIAHEAIKVN